MPEIHRSTPHVIPADAGNQRKTKHAISTQTTNTPFTATPLPQQRVPGSASHSPPPPEGEIKRGSQGEGNRAARGRGPPKQPTPQHHRSTPNNDNPSFPSFQIFRILVLDSTTHVVVQQ